MQKVLTAEEMREVDRLTVEKYGIPFILLMENAAHAAANAIKEKLGGSVAGKSFLILCGKGNNGGDGAALARILWMQSAKVTVNLLGKIQETKGEARTNFEIANKVFDFYNTNAAKKERLWIYEYNGERWAEEIGFFMQDVVVDAVFGTGLLRPVEGQFAELFNDFAQKKNRPLQVPLFVSLDIPSGLNADLSEPIGSNINADLTITFTAPKPANVLPPAARFNGELVIANIGSPQELIDAAPSQLFLAEKRDAQNWLQATKFTVDSYKNARGHALVVAGSRDMSGAAVLSANAAMTSGVGLVTVAAPNAAQTAVASRVLPEVMVAAQSDTASGAIAEIALENVLKLSEKMNAALVGCGLSSNEETTKSFVRKFVENRRSAVVIDADGLNALAPFDLRGDDEKPLILTPHIGEMRRLLGVDANFDLSDRVRIAREFANKHCVILVLKGERTLIAAPDGKVVVNPTGNAGLGKAGNGDTLAGIICGFLGQTFAAPQIFNSYAPGKAAAWQIGAAFEATIAALYVAGLAGDIAADKIGMRAMTASSVREYLGEAMRRLENE